MLCLRCWFWLQGSYLTDQLLLDDDDDDDDDDNDDNDDDDNDDNDAEDNHHFVTKECNADKGTSMSIKFASFMTTPTVPIIQSSMGW